VPDRQPPNGSDAGDPLPPDLDPRGRRVARAEARRRAAIGASVQSLGTPPSGGRSRATARRRSGPDIWFGALVGVKIICALLSLTILVYAYFYWSTYRQVQASVPTAAALPSPSPGTKDVDGKDQNILLLGNDSRTGATPEELHALATTDDGGSANTDTMMIMHIPADGSKATVLSFPRDSYVSIPGYGKAKLNAAYPDGYTAAKSAGKSEIEAQGAGIAVLAATLNNLTGLNIDHYVQIGLLGFYRISNAIGGVPVLLCQAQKEPKSGINLPAGWSTIQGTQALAFVRQRYDLPRGDLDRIQRQQYFLSAVFRQLTNSGTLLNPFKIRSLLNAVSSSLLTDGINLLSLASDFAQMSSGNLTFSTIPTDGFGTADGQSIVIVDPTEVKTFVDEKLGIKGAPAPSTSGPTVAANSFQLDVVNESGENGAAGRAATSLRQLGYTVDQTLSGDTNIDKTTIQYPTGLDAQARTVLAKVPGATLVQSSSVQRVTLLLGTDGVTPGATTSPSSSAGTTSATASTPTPTATATGPTGGIPANTPNQAGCIN
jgi:LCP family protein required for cell wall assembly